MLLCCLLIILPSPVYSEAYRGYVNLWYGYGKPGSEQAIEEWKTNLTKGFSEFCPHVKSLTYVPELDWVLLALTNKGPLRCTNDTCVFYMALQEYDHQIEHMFETAQNFAQKVNNERACSSGCSFCQMLSAKPYIFCEVYWEWWWIPNYYHLYCIFSKSQYYRRK